MSVQPEDFLAPSAFLEQPGFLEAAPELSQPPVEANRDFAKVAIGVAAAIVIWRLLVKNEFSREDLRSQDEINEAAGRIYRKVLPAWLRVAVPAIAQAYRLGVSGTPGEVVPYSMLEKMATNYVEELGSYVHQTSILALTEGFNAQVNAGWSERLAWERAREAYGLDSRQMRSYVKGLVSRDKSDYVTDPIPAASRAVVDRLFLIRADMLGTNEAFKATQVGRNMVWLSMEANGKLPDGTMKRWVTADDERVCVVCGPLHMVTIPLHRRFESNGQFFYAPGVHPNCRCELDLVYPDLGTDIVKSMPGDPFDRDVRGRFNEVEERKTKGLLDAKKGLLKTGLLSQEGLVGDNAESTGLLSTKGLLSSEGLLSRPEGGMLAREEKGLLAKPLSEEHKAEVKAVPKKKTVALKPRALTEGAAQEKAAVQEEGLLQSQKKKAGFTRGLRPEDPQKHETVMWIAADPFMRMRRNQPYKLGDEVTLGYTYLLNGTPKTTGTEGWSEEKAWAEDAGYILASDINTSDAFAKAFEDYMTSEEGGNYHWQNRKTSADQKLNVSPPSAYSRFGTGDDLKPFTKEREILSGRSRAELLSLVDYISQSPTAQLAISDDTLLDNDWREEASADDIAEEIMQAILTESRWGNDQWRDNVDSLPEPDDEAYNEYQEHSIFRTAEQASESASGLSAMSEGGSASRALQPTFFKLQDWYGVADPVTGTAIPGAAEGTYEVVDIEVKRVPEDLNDNVVSELMANVVVVTLKLVRDPDGRND